MANRRSADMRRALAELVRTGFLLCTDAQLPSVASLVVGEPIRGSWWAHPAHNEIYDVAVGLEDHTDVLVAKLVSGKDTYVHRRLWPALLAVGSAGEPWQLEGLSATAERILAAVTRHGELRSDDVPWTGGEKKDSPGEAVRLLGRRLLAHIEEVHTESGAHAKRLESWDRWADGAGIAARAISSEDGKREFGETLDALNTQFRAGGTLPWRRSRRGRA